MQFDLFTFLKDPLCGLCLLHERLLTWSIVSEIVTKNAKKKKSLNCKQPGNGTHTWPPLVKGLIIDILGNSAVGET